MPSDALLRNGSCASCDASNCRDCRGSFNARFRRGRLNFKPGLSLGRYATAVTGCRDIRGDDLILNEHTREKSPSPNGDCGPRRLPTTDHEKSVNNDPSHTQPLVNSAETNKHSPSLVCSSKREYYGLIGRSKEQLLPSKYNFVRIKLQKM